MSNLSFLLRLIGSFLSNFDFNLKRLVGGEHSLIFSFDFTSKGEMSLFSLEGECR